MEPLFRQLHLVVFKPPATSVREDVGRARQLFWSTLMNHQGGGGCCLFYCSVQISAQIRPQSRDRKGNSHCLQCKGKEIPRMQFLRIGEGEGQQHVVVTRFFFFLHCRSMICLCTVAECTGFVRRSIQIDMVKPVRPRVCACSWCTRNSCRYFYPLLNSRTKRFQQLQTELLLLQQLSEQFAQNINRTGDRTGVMCADDSWNRKPAFECTSVHG